MASSYPLDESHYQAMNMVLDAVATAIPVAKKCADCGLDVDREIQVLQDRAEFAKKVKHNFFPELP